MTTPPPRETARRDSWKALPLPAARAPLGLEEAYTAEEFELIKGGLIPEAMEDKWFAFYEDPWLYLHRSWTGACIYGLRFQPSDTGAAVVESWVSRDSDQYKSTQVDYDRAMCKFLIDALLLGRQAVFPVPGDVPASAPAGVYQHHVVGRAYPERAYLPDASRPGSLWERITQWFRGRR